jgi:hypothetical protein
VGEVGERAGEELKLEADLPQRLMRRGGAGRRSFHAFAFKLIPRIIIPGKRRVRQRRWIPAFAGMTSWESFVPRQTVPTLRRRSGEPSLDLLRMILRLTVSTALDLLRMSGG